MSSTALELHPHLPSTSSGWPTTPTARCAKDGASYAEIAADGGMPLLHAASARVSEAIAADRRDGVARGEAWPAESARVHARYAGPAGLLAAAAAAGA